MNHQDRNKPPEVDPARRELLIAGALSATAAALPGGAAAQTPAAPGLAAFFPPDAGAAPY